MPVDKGENGLMTLRYNLNVFFPKLTSTRLVCEKIRLLLNM